jgi:CRISPR/Cas system-associated exonuclease Cas4 (RecB family)
MSPEQIEERIAEMFEENYQVLRLEGGHALTEDIKQSALKQVIAYYRKLRGIAEKVTETEVKLTLPNQETPGGHKFNIEGIVDIVREDDEVWMYDLKTHDPDYIREHTELYESQLNVYAHIYENLRKNRLDHTAIISTSLPDNVKTALSQNDAAALERAFKSWDPVIEINYEHERVERTIDEFAKVVDKIEGHCFAPQSRSA